jgi:cell division protein FtsN
MRPEKAPAAQIDKNYKPTEKDLKLAGRDVRPAGMDGKPEPPKPGDKKADDKNTQKQIKDKDAVYDYTFLAGSFGAQTQAKELQAKLKKAGIGTVVEEATDNGVKTYRVNAMLRGKPDDAGALKQKLDAAGAKNALLRSKKPL